LASTSRAFSSSSSSSFSSAAPSAASARRIKFKTGEVFVSSKTGSAGRVAAGVAAPAAGGGTSEEFGTPSATFSRTFW
jgi:hypothetical protein